MKRHIPNILTLLNGVSGTLSIFFTSHSNYTMAAVLIAIAAVFDFFDGFVARLLKVSSPLGKDLDSLSDAISFGVAPTFLIFTVLYNYIGWVAFGVVVIVAGSVYRLGKFNNDVRQTHSFIGLPTPANALFWVGLGIYLSTHNELLLVPYVPYLVVGLSFLSSYLLVTELPMFSLKIKKGEDSVLKPIVLFILSLILISLLGFLGLSLSIVVYIIMSVVALLLKKKV